MASDSKILYTIGHSNHDIDHFVELLSRHQVRVVADVRSVPYSRFHSQFNREELTVALKARGLFYVYLGKELGARVDNPACCHHGKVNFAEVEQSELFQKGIERLLNGMQEYRIAIMCAEKDPIQCHRTILVARHLNKLGLSIQHILADGKLEDYHAAANRLVAELKIESTLFEPKTASELIEEALDKQAGIIAYEEIVLT